MKEYLPTTVSAFNHKMLNDIDGWLSPKEADVLFRLASECTGKGAIVEIGSWKGKSTTCLALGSMRGAGTKITAIDPHTGSSEHGDVQTFEEFQRNIAKNDLTDMVNPIVKPSQDVARQWNEPVELLWIDGAHEYEFVLQDLLLWEPHVIEGGIIAFHDSSMEGPWKVIEEHMYKGKKFHSIRFVHGITYATKGKVTPLKNRSMMLMRDAAYGLWKGKKLMGL